MLTALLSAGLAATTAFTAPVTYSRLTVDQDLAGHGTVTTRNRCQVSKTYGAGYTRAETFWDTDGKRIRLPRGSIVNARFTTMHRMNNPATGEPLNPKGWSVIFQLHGPNYSYGRWFGPPLSISVQDGKYKIGGGVASPGADGSLVNRSTYVMPYPDAPDNRWDTFRVQSYLEGPGSGWFSVWLNGKQIVNKMRPKAGTFYTDAGTFSHKDLQVKTGMYSADTTKTWNRSVTTCNTSIGWIEPNGTKHYAWF